MKKLATLAVTLLLFSCNTGKKVVSNESAPEFKVLTVSEYKGKEKKMYEVIQNEAQLKALYAAVEDPEVPTIDFKKSRIVALFLGEKNSGGYGIAVDKVTEKDNVVWVTVKETKPAAGEMSTMAITRPFTIVKIHTTKPIEFK
ncbi:protease complex subunit PrcB family protein [Flavobacterium kingsejongi]|uniref:PrcB C-terminal domain-containing protein n=1 Tax=Flavobacterium kingsejongi TaxID=1678728 RepID=A0A2S1LRV1_9FLAO|nr:protease complex subunit PrcB family protein [Flavobacterium kingsejongi]AWG26418.1 hypothetical protein FK004_14880 [Flavobacterium kingsejongi]